MIIEKFALRVAIGPVQGFIAAGRRTRDFWAGSFLLSYLSGVAMNGVITEADGGTSITVPAVFGSDGEVTEKTLKAIQAAEQVRFSEEAKPVRGPLVGTLVNHFRASVPHWFDPSHIESRVRQRFSEIADAIFDFYIEPALFEYAREDRVKAVGTASVRAKRAEEIRKRWNIQTDGKFFEIIWAMGPEKKGAEAWREESRWLDRRKTVRIHPPIDETLAGLAGTGDPCPVHPDLRELGGFSRVFERAQQEDFWQVLRHTVGTRMYLADEGGMDSVTDAAEEYRDTLEIRSGERLSGMALVKRLFPLLPAETLSRVLGWVPSDGFDVDVPEPKWDPKSARRALRNWPSTAFIAAAPWVITAGRFARAEAESYAEKQYKLLGLNPLLQAERPQRHRMAGINQLSDAGKEGKKNIPLFAVLDGTLHFKRGLEKHRFASGRSAATAESLARDLDQNLKQLVDNAAAPIRKGLSGAAIRKDPARPFYAMLDMDGDGMGEIFSVDEARALVGSKALLDFSYGVPRIVSKYDGVLIYAGADDVNAMLPIDTAIECALEIRRHWSEVMDGYFSGKSYKPTLSGSIVFADYQNALDDVRHLAHQRLEDVAKDGMGRDALALAVMKSGGVTAEWASCWDDVGGETGSHRSVFAEFSRFVSDCANVKSVASRLPYLIRDRFSDVLKQGRDGRELFSDDELVRFVMKELSDSGLKAPNETKAEREKRLTEWARRIVHVLRPVGRDSNKRHVPAARHVGGMLIARFLIENMFWPYISERKARETGTEKQEQDL